MMLDRGFWLGKRVVVTGHTGFKGTWLTSWLLQLGAKVTGVALAPNTTPAFFELLNLQQRVVHHELDINHFELLQQVVKQANPEVIFHLAAQPLVIESYQTPLNTFATNVMGTANVLEAARDCPSLKAMVIVTTDKVYQPVAGGRQHLESDHLGGHDPYSASKACTELVVQSYRDSFYNQPDAAKIATVRAGNVIGGGDFAENRLVPDICRAWANNEPVVIRQPKAIRPWQHVLDALHGYLLLAQHIIASPVLSPNQSQGKSLARAWNIGPNINDMWPVEQIVSHMQTIWPNAAGVQLEPAQYHENPSLLLDNHALCNAIGWQPVWNIGQALEQTARWYQTWAKQGDVTALVERQIKRFMT